MPEKLDADYMKAVESGDMETAQRMVDEAARKAGYTTKGFHGTPNGGFTTFNTRKTRFEKGVDNTVDPNTFLGSHFAEEPEVAQRLVDELYGADQAQSPQLYGVYLNVGRPLGGDALVQGDVEATRKKAEEADGVRSQILENDTAIRNKEREIEMLVNEADLAGKLPQEDRTLTLDAADLIDSIPLPNSIERKLLKKPEFKDHPTILAMRENIANRRAAIEALPGHAVLVDALATLREQDIMLKAALPTQSLPPLNLGVKGKDAYIEGDRGLLDEGGLGGFEAFTDYSLGRDPREEASPSFLRSNRAKIGRNMRANFDKLPYDSILYRNAVEGGVSIIVKNPEQIKSADPVTYDEQGNIIPPSKRFDPMSEDIRYMPDGNAGENSKYATPPSEESARDAISTSKRPFWGKHRDSEEGEKIGVRIDIPAYLSKGVYVQTVHEPATPGNVGDRIGYDTHIRLKNGVKFFVKEGSPESRQGAVAIKEGRANKHPIATVEGSYSKDRTTPKDINDWIAVGMNPDKHSYFYDKKTDRPVIGGDESYSVNNTVFVKNPVYGKKSDFRFLPEIPTAPQDTKFNSVTEQGGKMLKGDYKNVIPGAILGTLRFLPESENARILANFPLDDSAKKKMEGKAGFAFASDWSDSNRPYLTKNGRKIDVLMGGVGYTYHPEVIGKGGWAGSFSALTNRVLKKINQTDGIGLVVAGGRESTASSRSFSIAALEEIKDDVANGTISKAAIDNIIKNNAERLLGLTSVKSLSDYEKLLMLERGGSGLTFEQRAEMVKAINSHENKKKFGLSSWNDILKKYEMQSGSFEPGQIMSVVQFDKNAPLIKASDLNIKGHKSYEAVIQGKPLGMLKEKVMIADFFKDFFTSEGTLPASYTRKVQTKMPSFKYGEGSAILKEAAKSIANAEKLK
jgi:hypothetical protein